MRQANFTLNHAWQCCFGLLLMLAIPIWGSTQTFTGAGLPLTTVDAACVTSAATAGALGIIGTDTEIDNVTLDITHTFDGDLILTLISPAGTSLTLSSENGGSADNYTNTVFTDGGGDITVASPPFTGTFTPEGGTFATTFAGESAAGNWTLEVCDVFFGDQGTVDSYSISFSSLTPLTAAPDPFCDQADVISMYSNSYADVPVDTWLTPWSPGPTTLTDLLLFGNDTKLYENVDFLGVEMFGTPIDASAMTTFNVDVWTPNMTTFRVKLVEFNGGTFVSEGEIALTPTQFGWNTFSIPMADFSDPTKVTNPAFTLSGTSELSQLIFSGLPAGGGKFYLDNVYFSTSACPTAAPEPTCDAANVISMYSNSYADVPVDTWLTPWSPGPTTLTDLQIAGNDTKLYENVDFLGVEMFGTPIDASAMTTFNVDVWTPNMTTFRVKLVEFNGGTFVSEGEIALTPTQFGWNTFSIPMADFSDPTKVTNPAFTLGGTSELSQLIFSGLPAGSGTFYLDNVYFSTCAPVVDDVVVTICGDFSCELGYAAQRILSFPAGGGDLITNLTENRGDDVWCADITLAPGETFEYFFVYSTPTGVENEDLSGLAGEACVNAAGTRRIYTAPTAPTTAPEVIYAWESCISTAECAPTTPIEFCVDLNCTDLPNDAVAIAFDFAGFNPIFSEYGLTETEIGSRIYCRTFDISFGEVEYRFFYAPGGTMEIVPEGDCTVPGGGNRLLVVDENTLPSYTFAWESCAEEEVCPIDGEITISDPCNCNDDASSIIFDPTTGLYDNPNDGTFNETVSVNDANGAPLPDGLDIRVVGVMDAIGVAVGDPLTFDGFGYSITFDHPDDVGYSIAVDQFINGVPVGLNLQTTNLCAYPNPVFDPELDPIYCSFEDAITLGADDTDGIGADDVTFTINGDPATEFDPTALPEGDNVIVMTYDGASNGNVSPDGGTTPAFPGCTQTVETTVFVENLAVGCVGDLNVTLREDCSVTVTPTMVLSGSFQCADEINVTINGGTTDIITGCGTHTYSVDVIVAGEIVYTCWGTILAEDKTAPVVECPDNTDNVDVEFDIQTLDGSIDGTEPTLNLDDYSCFQSFFEPAAGVAYNYDLITFTVDPDLPATDVYNIQTISNIPGLNIALFQGAFNAENPCENILGGSEGAYFVDPFFGVNAFFAQDFRIELALEPGQTYTLFVANTSFGTTGDYSVGIVSDNGGTFENSGFSAPRPVVANLPLYCEDLNLVQVTQPTSYTVTGDGTIISIPAGLRDILDLTGYPDVTDNCGPVLVTVTDDVNANGDCGSIVITRTFLVADRADGACLSASAPVLTAVCEQIITLNRPTVFDLVLPPYTATLECDENFATDGSVGGPDDNPAASATGYPFLLTAQGYVDLAQNYCNLGANYSDEPRINVCEGSYKFRREWNIIDWCSPSDNVIWQQYVKVADYTGPELTGVGDMDISTSPFSCVANVVIPCPTLTDGNGCSSVAATTYTILAFGQSFFATGDLCEGELVQVPIGEHTLILCAEDDCGNETCEEYELNVADEIEPSAACDDQLNVSIGGGDSANGIQGIARIFAADVDEGSNDNCGDVTLEVRRNFWRNNTCDPSPNRFSPWGDFVDFYCCDIDVEITIELRVTDESGNRNICWLVVTPEDKLIPFCFAPDDVELDCDDLPLTFPGNIEEAYDADFNGTSVMMTALFGGASGTDNCAVDTIIERSPNIQVNECGWGTITRRFEAWQVRPEGDVNGNGAIDIGEVFRSNNSCFQVITVNEVHDFEIDFPEDAEADCGDPDVPTIETTATGCDVLSVNVGDPVRFSATGDECYKLSITYDVINWCVWDGEYEGLRLPRITEDDGEDLPVDRGVEGNERPVVRVISSVGPVDNNCDDIDDNEDDDVLQYTVVIDRRHTDRNGDSSIPNTTYDNIPGNGIPCIPADQFGRRNYGRYIYTQFVKVYDSTAPVVTVDDFGGPTANCPDLEPGQFGDDDGNCVEEVTITFSVADECELFDGEGNLVVEIVSAELDAFAVDANNDGDIKANEFVAEAGPLGDASGSITDNEDGTYTLQETYPIITNAMGDNVFHAVRILFRDGCGNLTSTIIVFDVIDCKGPAPICINGLTVTLMPQEPGTDADGDGDEDSCAMAIWANDFEGSPIDDCTGQGPDLGPSGLPRVTKYAIYRADDVEADPDFVPSTDDTGLVLTQDDDLQTIVYVYAFDEEGNYDYCETYILVQFENCNGPDMGIVNGIIATESNETVEGVEVSLSGGMTATMTTNTDGTYSFSYTEGGDYSVTPYLNANPLNGVSTFDLVLISKHILGVQSLDSPYKLIAADVNNSSTVTTLDMIRLRKLILNIDTEFVGNTSWRFVSADYDFPAVNNPWFEVFPELHSVNNAAGVIVADFVGVKIGDVNGSAQANALAGDDRTLNGQFNLDVENVSVKAGNLYTVAVRGADMASVEGFQGTLNLNGAELVDIEYGVATAENFGMRYAAEGQITASWNGKATSEDVLFSLVIRPTVDAELSDVISVNSRYTAAEAYGNGNTMNVGVNFSNGTVAAAGFELYQNTPNPFSAETLIGFNLPEDAEAIVTISDASGRLITQLRGDYAAGYNTLNITKEMIQGATGVLTYTVNAGEFTATKQMIVIK